jgi:formate-dependent phosphoribosylglycinamide formyltransferase (GAR transformylase)
MPRNVVFVAPFPIETTMRFVRAVARLDDVRLLGVVHTPPAHDGADGRVYADVVRVTEPLSTRDTIDGVEVLRRRHGPIHRIVSILEPLMVPIAQAREHFGVPGTLPATADLFRDKSRMKAALSQAGLGVARSRLVAAESDARSFADEVGFPMVLKPPAGMGAKSTFRVSNLENLVRAVSGMGASAERPVLAEEMLRGQELSFETLTVGGAVRAHSISQYLPGCLEVLENPWIQWVCFLPKDVSGPEYDGARAMGFKAIEALGLDNGVTHMEWFRRDDGRLAIGEIAQRPPGANITRMIGLANDVDAYRAWARAVVDGEVDAPWVRKHAVGCAFLRGMGHGRVAAVTGVNEANEAVGKWVVESKLPSIGAPKSDSYEGDGHVIARGETDDEVKRALRVVIETVKVHYAG